MNTPLKLILMSLALAIPVSSYGLVDMKSANYSDTWTDMTIPGVGYDLKVNRTYNSRSLFDGLFGFGWCSDYETKIEVTPESNLKLTECGGGMETIFMPRNFKPKKIENTVDEIISQVKKRRPDLQASYLAKLANDLNSDEFMREEFSRRLNIKGSVKRGVVYLANGREAENITLKEGTFKRMLSDGTYELFDAKTGHMTYMYDKNQNYLKLNWDRNVLTTVVDNMGRKLTFKYDPVSKKISRIIGPNGLQARYVVKGEDLVQATDAKGQKFKYDYDDVHNLTKIAFADGTYKQLTYNKDKDWVTSFRNRKGCLETYDYQVSKDDPQNHFWSLVKKVCGTKVTNRSKYEFFHRHRTDGPGVYLYRVRTENNNHITDIIYHQVFGKPISIVRDNRKTDYTYYDNGFVKTKREPGRMMSFLYNDPCHKVSQVKIDLFGSEMEPVAKKSVGRHVAKATAQSKVVRSITTQFRYEPKKCNLTYADSSDGQAVRLQYDLRGRISQIEDQSKKLVKIKYETRFGKPWIVLRPGLGSIEVTYQNDGEIKKVDSKEGPKVAVQVASIFNNLLDIIAPATSEAPL